MCLRAVIFVIRGRNSLMGRACVRVRRARPFEKYYERRRTNNIAGIASAIALVPCTCTGDDAVGTGERRAWK